MGLAGNRRVLERYSLGEELEEENPEGVHVGAGVELIIGRVIELGRDVGRILLACLCRGEDSPTSREVGTIEVGEPRIPLDVDQDGLGAHIPVDQPAGVDGLEGVRHAQGDVEAFAESELLPLAILEEPVERAVIGPLRNLVELALFLVLVEGENLKEVRMPADFG